tara:strand:+ start:46 stop:210 length:165 start_codon:yes stop_codon:yes gene_type:complete
MISNIGSITSAIAGMRMVNRHPALVYNRRNLAIKKKREEERAERKRKILAYRNK